jgi:hypothetical protein
MNADIISVFEAALVLPALDDCDKPVFERTPNQYSKPQTGQFTVLSDGIVINAGSLNPDSVLGLWLVRKFTVEGNPVKSCEELCEDYDNEVKLEKEDELQIDVSWDDAESVSVSSSVSESASV